MISLKDACQKILSRHPDEYIHVVNEYETVYAFILLNKGEKSEDCTGIFFASTVDKQTGEIEDDRLLIEDIFSGDFKQYTRKDLEGL